MKGCFKKTGVYAIINTVSGKMYIGSSNMSLEKRLWHHISLLRNKTHKNTHLQNSWDKHGEGNFITTVLELCDRALTLEKEQIWIEKFFKTGVLFNINPNATGTPNLSNETIEKRRQTLIRRYKSGELKSNFSGKPSWNLGLTKDKHDYSYLKVPKKVTELSIRARKKCSEKIRESMPEVFVYSKDLEFLGKWRSSKDLECWSLTDYNNLPIKSRFKGDYRMGVPTKFLNSSNIMKVIDSEKTYKSLLFKTTPPLMLKNGLLKNMER